MVYSYLHIYVQQWHSYVANDHSGSQEIPSLFAKFQGTLHVVLTTSHH